MSSRSGGGGGNNEASLNALKAALARHAKASKTSSSTNNDKKGTNQFQTAPSAESSNYKNQRPSSSADSNSKNPRPSSSAESSNYRNPRPSSSAESSNFRNPRPSLTADSNYKNPRPPSSAESSNYKNPSNNQASSYKCNEIGHIAKYCKIVIKETRDNKNERGSSNNDPNTKGNFPQFGYRKLFKFLTEDENVEVIMAIGRKLKDWKELIENSNDEKNEDQFILILHLLASKICINEIIVESQKLEIITTTLTPQFINFLKQKIVKLTFSEGTPSSQLRPGMLDIDKTRKGIIGSIYKVISFTTKRLPSFTLDFLKDLVPALVGVGNIMTLSSPDDTQLAELNQKINELFKQISEVDKDKKEERETESKKKNWRFGSMSEEEEKLMHDSAPPDDFRSLSIFPTCLDLLSNELVFLRTNKKSGAYYNADHYLDVQFRLLREDFMGPLRVGVQDYLKFKTEYLAKTKKFPIGNVRLYPDVLISSSALIKGKLIYSIQLPHSVYSRTKWEKSKRLLNGSLLVFSSNDFKTAHFATVVVRDEKKLSKNGELGVVWQGAPPVDITDYFIMLESEVYFEAYRYTLQSLKDIELAQFPLCKFIVFGSEEVEAPHYLANAGSQIVIKNKFFSPLEYETWPSREELGLDTNQYDAFKAALTTEFSIIQGPPGTGKTFIGLQLAETLLLNSGLWLGHSPAPILVVCYTNHALDQFLEGIVRIFSQLLEPGREAEVVRVGSRTKSEEMERYSLYRKREIAARTRSYTTEYASAKRIASSDVAHCEREREGVLAQTVGLRTAQGIINFQNLTGLDEDELRNEIPSEFLNLMKAPNCFALNNPVLEQEQMNEHEIVQKWFGSFLPHASAHYYKSSSNEPPKIAKNAPNAQNYAQNNESDEDDEDYNMDELTEHRIIENNEYDDEIESILASNRKNYGHFVYLASLSGIDKEIELTINKIQSINRLLSDKESKNRRHELERDKDFYIKRSISLQNRWKILSLILHSYREGELRLPTVEQILDRCLVSRELDNGGILRKKYDFDVKKLSVSERYALYFHYIEKVAVVSKKLVGVFSERLVKAHAKLEEIKNMGDVYLLRGTKVVGMTTTGAAKHRNLLEMIKPKIVIVEEAAEVLESHIVTCLTRNCQHLVLIGDHQQLRPSTTVYKLAKNYNLDISLFERMINNNLNVYKLKVQHRMRPEISDLVRGTIYAELDDHPSVFDYPNVRGMKSNLFFISHNQKESNESDSKTKLNEFEADFLSSLCRHLILQDYKPERITILTTYLGQMFLIKKKIGKIESCKGVRVTVVDNYQGEENDIILLSLVRSNDDNNIGFLKTDNRICVAISRAKHGLYICGNMDSLSSNSSTWCKIRDKLEKRVEIGTQLTIICEIHKTPTLISNGAEFMTKSPEGGCMEICNALLKCTHHCDKICHVMDRNHEEYRCRKPCLEACENNHPCLSQCFKNCPPCEIKMDKNLPCGHILKLKCSTDPSKVVCMEIVNKIKGCGHEEDMACHKDPLSIKCREKVIRTLECKHEKELLCHVDPTTINCKVKVVKLLVACGHEVETQCHRHIESITCTTEVEKIFPDCGHKTKVKCSDQNKENLFCRTICSTRLDCGHACTKICHVNDDPDHVEYECRKKCVKKCEQNLHDCGQNHDCSKPCPPCVVKTEKVLGCGTHVQKDVPCNFDPAFISCESRCERINLCGHKCTKKCSENCLPCQTIVSKTAPCGHGQDTKCGEAPSAQKCEKLVRPNIVPACFHDDPDTKVPCRLKNSITAENITKDFCNRKCDYVFGHVDNNGCSHTCQGTCSKCSQGRLHLKCMEKCGRNLFCGHACDVACSASCPPCKKNCFMKCEHSECKKLCGEPCSPCKEKCSWVCKHKRCTRKCGDFCNREPCDEPCPKILPCNHPCIGFCGEECPTQCRVCNKDEVTEILFGMEDEEDARFIYLPDCKHVFEAQGLTYYMKTNIEEGEVQAKNCPKCKTIIRNCRRFSNILKTRLVDIMKLKSQIYGSDKKTHVASSSLVNKVVDNLDWKKYFLLLHEHVTNKLITRSTSRNARTQLNPNAKIKYGLKQVSKVELESLRIIVQHGEDGIKILKEAENKLFEKELFGLKLKYIQLFNALMRRSLPLTFTEMQNFDLEFERIYDLYQLFLRFNNSFYVDKAHIGTILYDQAMKLIEEPKIYTDELKNRFKYLLKVIDA